jgi:hypothetical protein
MTTFPALVPSQRTYIQGDSANTAHPTYRGGEVRVKHSNGIYGVRLRLFFRGVTTAQMLLVKAHFREKKRFATFDVPDECLEGLTSSGTITPPGHQWRYTSRVQVADIPINGSPPSNRHNVTVEIGSVPVRPAIFVPRTIYRQTLFAPTVEGTAPPIVNVPLLTYESEAYAPTVAAVTGSGPEAPIGELIHLPFTDDALDYGPQAYTVSAVNGASYSGSGGKWSSGCAEFDGTNDYYRILASDRFLSIGSTDILTFEGWFYATALPAVSAYACIAWSGHIYVGLFNSGGSGRLHAFVSANGGGSFPLSLTSGSTAVAINSWNYFQVYRDPVSPGKFTLELNNISQGNGTNAAVAGVLPGSSQFTVGAYAGAAQPFAGRVNNIRLTAGEVMPTAVPTAAFPTTRPTPDPIDILADLSPVAWWDASDASTITITGGKVSQWDDKSGNGWHLSQGTAGRRPSIASGAQNGLDAMAWPTTGNDYHFTTAAGTFTAAEIYAVMEFDGGGAFPNYNGLITNAGGAPLWFIGSVSTSLFPGDVEVYINGNNVSNRNGNLFPEIDSPCLVRMKLTSGNFTTTSGVMVGSDVNVTLNRGWEKHICEIIAVPSALSLTERYSLESELKDKWGI